MHEQYLMMKKVGQHLLKGVVMFMILNIDVADKNPKYKSQEHQTEADAEPTPGIQTTALIQTMMLNKAKREQKTTRVILQQVILQEIAQQQPKLRPLLIRVHMNLLELIRPKS